MTPTEQDKELRENLESLVEKNAMALCCNDCHGGGYDYENTKDCSTCNGTGLTEWRNDYLIDTLMQLITAEKKRVALEAAIMGAKFGNAAFRQYSIANPGQSINLDDVRRSGIEQATEWVERYEP